jgi:hypothetical protein
LPVSLEEQLTPGTLEFTIHALVESRIDMSVFENRYKNDETGRRAYDPKILLKVVVLAYSRGIVSSRRIEDVCRKNAVFMAQGLFSQLFELHHHDNPGVRGHYPANEDRGFPLPGGGDTLGSSLPWSSWPAWWAYRLRRRRQTKRRNRGHHTVARCVRAAMDDRIKPHSGCTEYLRPLGQGPVRLYRLSASSIPVEGGALPARNHRGLLTTASEER